MRNSNIGATSAFVHFYRGVEEFYFLNKSGELGYIKSGELRPVKETFPQLSDREFMKSNPDFVRELDNFLKELIDVSAVYLENSPRELELGYMLPAGDRHEWRSSTLVLHKHVLDALKTDHETMVQKGIKGLGQAERDLARIMEVRSIHQGFDELTYHRDAIGRYRYFPALIVVPDRTGADESTQAKSNVRVINLRWRDSGARLGGNRPEDDPRPTRELVFSVLRENLTHRGAIDRSRRMENRLSIV